MQQTNNRSGEANTTIDNLSPVNSPCPATTEISVNITFIPCPDGFIQKGSACMCDVRLQQFNTTCNVDDSSIENTFRIDALYNNGSYERLVIHSGCPFDYCVDTPVNITFIE